MVLSLVARVPSSRSESGVRSAPGRRSMLSLTPRDFLILRDLARHRVLSGPWLARVRFGGSLMAARKRLRVLVAWGFVERLATTHGEYRGHRLSGRGRRVTGMSPRARLREPGVGPVQVLHAMTVAEVAVELLRTVAPHDPAEVRYAWVTEQELFEGEGADWLPPGTFLPDGVIEAHERTGQVERAAVEVELHRKAAPRYVKKLSWYKGLLDGGALVQLRYYVADTTVETTVRRALRAAGFADDDPAVWVRRLPAAVPIYGRRTPGSE